MVRRCEACCREFTGRSPDCPWCGFNNAPRGGPRSARSLALIEQDGPEHDEFERELVELTDDMALCLGRNQTVEEPERTPT